MVEKNTTEKILEAFFREPTRTFHLRELSRHVRLSMPSVLSATERLSKEKLLVIRRGKALTIVSGNMEDPRFTRLKRLYNIRSLYATGLVDFLYTKFNRPSAIICFGSYGRGEDIEKSDIDIAILGSRKITVDLSDFERKLMRKISLHIVEMGRISEEFRHNLFNGIVLEGAV